MSHIYPIKTNYCGDEASQCPPNLAEIAAFVEDIDNGKSVCQQRVAPQI
jgi:hypothetical protein